MRLQELKRRVDEADYRVDVDAVASAILRRPDARRLLLAGHPMRPERATPRRGAHSAPTSRRHRRWLKPSSA